MHRRTLSERVLDRAWTRIGAAKMDRTAPPVADSGDGGAASVSGTMGWPRACAALVSGRWTSRGFRRRHAVCQVVETLGASDGRHFARWIGNHHPEWLECPDFQRSNDWGDPLQAPGWVLGTRRAFSPTSLRYLAHSLWLHGQGLLPDGGPVVEIGVGFGGFAATNAMVARAATFPVDLPEVAAAARLMIREIDRPQAFQDHPPAKGTYTLVSYYAFSELNADLQDDYFERFIRDAPRGAILSNAAVFSKLIGGRSDEDLVSWFRKQGIPAIADRACPILGPADKACEVTLIRWNQNQR